MRIAGAVRRCGAERWARSHSPNNPRGSIGILIARHRTPKGRGCGIGSSGRGEAGVDRRAPGRQWMPADICNLTVSSEPRRGPRTTRGRKVVTRIYPPWPCALHPPCERSAPRVAPPRAHGVHDHCGGTGMEVDIPRSHRPPSTNPQRALRGAFQETIDRLPRVPWHVCGEVPRHASMEERVAILFLACVRTGNSD